MAEPPVGRIGAEGAWVLVEGPPRHDAPLAHVRPPSQQPPPRLAGHEKKPLVQVYAVVAGEEVGVGVVGADIVVGTMITAVEEEGGGGGEEEGWT